MWEKLIIFLFGQYINGFLYSVIFFFFIVCFVTAFENVVSYEIEVGVYQKILLKYNSWFRVLHERLRKKVHVFADSQYWFFCEWVHCVGYAE